MNDSTKVTLTVGQLQALVNEGLFDWFKQKKKQPAAPQQAKQVPQGNAREQPITKQQQGFLGKRIENYFTQMISACQDGETLKAALQAIINSDDTKEAMASIKDLSSKSSKTAESEIDEGLVRRTLSKVAGMGAAAKAALNNVDSWASSDDAGNSPIAKQSIRGAIQTEKFATAIKLVIKDISQLRDSLAEAAIQWKTKPEDVKAAKEMISKMDSFIKKGEEALKQVTAEIKAKNYNRKEKASADAKKGNDDTSADGEKDKSKEEKKPDGDDVEKKKKDEEDGGEEKKVSEDTKIALTYGQLKDLLLESQMDEAFLDKVKGFAKGAGQVAGGVAKALTRNAIDSGKAAVSTAKDIKKELGQKKTWTRSVWGPAEYAEKLSRIIADFEKDLKTMHWSSKQNPGLAKVIKDLEVSANEIHGQGEKGKATGIDKLKYQAGKLAGATATGVATGLALGALTAPLRSFMSPRAHAALVAAATVLLRALVTNMDKMDTRDDEKEKKTQPANEDLKGSAKEVIGNLKKGQLFRYITPQDIASAVTAGIVAYIRNDAQVDDQQQLQTSQNKGLTNELPSVWKSDGSLNIKAVHWKNVPGRGMVPFGPDKQPLTGKALALAQQLRRQVADQFKSSMRGRSYDFDSPLVNTLSDF